MDQHGWSMLAPTPFRASASAEIEELESLVKEWKPIRGGMEEILTHLPLADPRAEDIRCRIPAACQADQLAALESLGLPVDDICCSEMAVLRADPGVGLQPIHFDIPYYVDAVLLMYCNKNMSTAISKLPLWQMRGTFTEAEEPPLPEAMELLVDSNFISIPVDPGALLAFRTDVPHFGVRNNSSTPRVLLFALWGPKIDPPKCFKQRFPKGEKNHQ
jgi:hypothetical protein